MLRFAHEKRKGHNFTSDTELIQDVYDLTPLLITGGRNLMKVTYKGDLKILDVIINEN
jgi:2-C-methyl-D-erythritol 4-phosphate cytidylyltransferase